MNPIKKYFLLSITLLWTTIGFSQAELKFTNIGDFETTNGEIIKDCKIGYRTVGKLNSEKSNAVLWPTWFTGTSENICNTGFINLILDTTDLYVIIVDALTNGVSSSPSNTSRFPDISIRDMVNSEHELLINHLNINHLQFVMGISLGGMQAFEWAVAYPDFMDKVISIVGSPKLSSYDKLVLQTMSDLITNAGKNKKRLAFAYKKAHSIFLMNLNTPTYFTSAVKSNSLDTFLNLQYSQLIVVEDYLASINAMVKHDIYKSAGVDINTINNVIKADLLIIISVQDHMVNPISSVDLSKTLNAKLVNIISDYGHAAAFYEPIKTKNAILKFTE